VQFLQTVLYQCLLVRSIEYDEAPAVSQLVDISSQYPCAGRMERTDPYAFDIFAKHPLQSFLHLSGSLIGEGNGQYRCGVDWIDPHDAAEPVLRFSRYAATCCSFAHESEISFSQAFRDTFRMICVPVLYHICYPVHQHRSLS